MSSETEGEEFDGLDEEDLSSLELDEEPPEPQRPPKERREAKRGRPPGRKSKAKAKAEDDDEEPGEPKEKPPLTEDTLGLVEVMAVMPLVLASQLLSTPQKPIVFHNESIRQVKLAARKYAKHVHATTEMAVLTPLNALLFVYATAIGGAYMSQARGGGGGGAAPAAQADPRNGPRPERPAGRAQKQPREYGGSPDRDGVVQIHRFG